MVLAEAKTHRIFSRDDGSVEHLIYPGIGFNDDTFLSRNSASSRAIPFKKMVEMVEKDPFIPLRWQLDHSGMQGTEYYGEGDAEVLTEQWLKARDSAVKYAKSLNNYPDGGVTKQICNRLLEPFMWHTVIVTASEFENFFALRAHPAAEIHIADLAEKMLQAYNESTPVQLKAGEWHIPFGDQFDDNRLKEIIYKPLQGWPEGSCFEIDLKEAINDLKLKVSVARCARISYLNFEGKDDYEADIALYERLKTSGHFSPFEHCARAMTLYEYSSHVSGELEYIHTGCCTNTTIVKEGGEGWCGNFRGFIQLRKTIAGENRTDTRVIKK
jgi:hypothetical protein